MVLVGPGYCCPSPKTAVEDIVTDGKFGLRQDKVTEQIVLPGSAINKKSE